MKGLLGIALFLCASYIYEMTELGAFALMFLSIAFLGLELLKQYNKACDDDESFERKLKGDLVERNNF